MTSPDSNYYYCQWLLRSNYSWCCLRIIFVKSSYPDQPNSQRQLVVLNTCFYSDFVERASNNKRNLRVDYQILIRIWIQLGGPKLVNNFRIKWIKWTCIEFEWQQFPIRLAILKYHFIRIVTNMNLSCKNTIYRSTTKLQSMSLIFEARTKSNEGEGKACYGFSSINLPCQNLLWQVVATSRNKHSGKPHR